LSKPAAIAHRDLLESRASTLGMLGGI